MKNVAQHGHITLSVSTHTRQMRSFDSTEHSKMIVLFLTAARPMPILKGLLQTRSAEKKGVTEPETEFCRVAVFEEREKVVALEVMPT